MSYTVLARRYRPRDFDELVGQESVAKTLRNAVNLGRTAHAYLFCGTRGVGKTSMARIFARAMNVSDELTDPDGVSSAIFRGDDLDVIEIDAASNTGVDNVRDLIANAGLTPARCPFKIYIIDEVHMLSKSAFNALLKIMEEPPQHVKFVLCTTEPEKIPATIQSRCQRFDFRAIPTAKIGEHLRTILKDESIEADDGAIMALARLGNGSLRDALSLTDRILATGASPITAGDVEELLGIPDQTVIGELVSAIASRDPRQAMALGSKIMERGVSIDLALDLLADQLRLLLVASAGGADQLIDVSEERRATASEQAKSFSLPALVHMIALCDATARSARSSAAARAIFDALLVRMCLADQFEPAESGADRSMAQQVEPKKKVAEPSLTPAPMITGTSSEASVTDSSADHVVEPKPAPVHDSPQSGEEHDQPLSVKQLWDLVTARTREANASMASLLDGLDAQAFDGRTVTLTINEHGVPMARRLHAQREKLANLISEVAGIRIQVTLRDESETATTDAASVAPDSPAHEAVRQDPVIRSALELFDGSVVRVERRGED